MATASTGEFTNCDHSLDRVFTPRELATDLALVRMRLRGLDPHGPNTIDTIGEYITQVDLDFLAEACLVLGACPGGKDYFPYRLTVLLHLIRHQAPWPVRERARFVDHWAVAALARHGAAPVALPVGFYQMSINEAAAALWCSIVTLLGGDVVSRN